MPITNSPVRLPNAPFVQNPAYVIPTVVNTRPYFRGHARPDQIRSFYSSYQQSQGGEQSEVANSALTKSIGASFITRLVLNYWNPASSTEPLAVNLPHSLNTPSTPSEILFTRLYELMDVFGHDEDLATRISNFEFFSSNYSADVGLEILNLCRRNTNSLREFDFEILDEFFEMICSGAFTSENLRDMIHLAETYGIKSAHFHSEARSLYQARNHMGWLTETDDSLRETFETFLTVPSLDFASKATLIVAFESRFESTQDQHDVWRTVQAVSQGIQSGRIDSGNSFYFAKRLKQSEYTLAAVRDDLNFFGLFSDQNAGAESHVVKSFYAFTNSKFQMTSRHLRGQGKFSMSVAHLPERSRKAWFVLEAAFGNPENLQLARLLFGNQSFNHRILDETEKRDLAIELFNAVADYMQLKQFPSLEAFRSDPLIQRWFDPHDESVQTYHDKTFRTNSLVRDKRNASGVALTALGFLKEFRGQVWASVHLNQFIPFPDENTDPSLRQVFAGRNQIDPDGLYSLYDEVFDDNEPVIFEVKSLNEGDATLKFSELKQFAPIQRGNAHGTLRYQFGRMAYHLTKNSDLRLHYHLITDVQSVTKDGESISDEVRATAFKRLLQRYLERELNLSKDKAYDVMDRVIVTFETYLKTE